jgi:hypothetical protein
MRYRIEQYDGQWIIIHPSDNDLTWTGRFWADVELWGDSPLTFASRDEAAAYAQSIWGES